VSRRLRRRNQRLAVSAAAVVVVVAVAHGHGHAAASGAAPSSAAAAAVAFARAQLGKPYVYGATGPDAFDCSGLVQAAWAAAGVSIPRTSELQWADLPHVSSPRPGDLIFYTGSSIDPPPGHVTMYIGGGRMLEAYGTGVPIRVTGLRSGVWGYARPGGAS
jgi:cell wall-associated NlpC family hydrolase